MFSLRPHKIQFKSTVGGGTDINGDPIPINNIWTDPIPCHYDTQGRQLIYQHPDGRALVYDYVVFIDPGKEEYAGTFARLIDQHGNIREHEKLIQKCINGQLSTKLYL